MELDLRDGAGRQGMAHGDQANILVAAIEGGHVQAVLADLQVPTAVNDLPETRESLATTRQRGEGVLRQASLPTKRARTMPPMPLLLPVLLPGPREPLTCISALAKRHCLGVFCGSIGVEGFFSHTKVQSRSKAH